MTSRNPIITTLDAILPGVNATMSCFARVILDISPRINGIGPIRDCRGIVESDSEPVRVNSYVPLSAINLIMTIVDDVIFDQCSHVPMVNPL